jgi:hypothetical protein
VNSANRMGSSVSEIVMVQTRSNSGATSATRAQCPLQSPLRICIYRFVEPGK